MSIGTFSRASHVSVKALRSYHELGLLVPDSIDAATGYRSYRVSQLPDAVVVKRLRSLDVPLRDIAEVVAARDPQTTRRVIARHEQVMRERLADAARIVDELQVTIDLPSLATPVHVREEPERHALSCSGRVNDGDYAPFLAVAFDAIFAAAASCGADAESTGSARYTASLDADDEPVEAYVPIAEPISLDVDVLDTGVTLCLVPKATCAVAIHAGGYESIGDTYRQLGAWVARHAAPSGEPVREHYVVSLDPATGGLLPDERLRTEICWPVHPPHDDMET